MRIYIEYDSCWQNSILDNNTISKKSSTRKFNKSKPEGNAQKITKNTILGILYRLIGDQRTLLQIKKSENQYFSDLNIQFILNNKSDYEELVMLINKSNDRTSDGKYIGVPKDDVELFFADNAKKLWSALYLNPDEMIAFIITPKLLTTSGSSLPRDILNRINDIQNYDPLETMERSINKEKFKQDKLKEKLIKLQSIPNVKLETINKLNSSIEDLESIIYNITNDKKIQLLTQKISDTLSSLKHHFPEVSREDYLKKGGEIPLIRLYAAALYLQAELLEKSGEDISDFYVYQTKGSNKGFKVIQGFSKKGFNGVRDFLNPLSTGGNKKTVKTPFLLTKASGKLEINLDISKEHARELESMIDNAGVSSFYLGKKGLAYVSSIRV